MAARFSIVDVFAREPLTGNQLAVFPDPGSVPEARMQAIAREMNFSETTFVTGIEDGCYDVRIFTPTDEMRFAGHPTLGTAWSLHRLGRLGERAIQRSPAGETPVSLAGDTVWFERTGTVGDDLPVGPIADALGIRPELVGSDGAAFGLERVTLRPAIADAGVEQVMVPFADPDVLAGVVPTPAIAGIAADGLYCFAPLPGGWVKARFFAPAIGVAEDPATGSAAAALGLYLSARAGDTAFRITQGEEIGRPSTLEVDASRGRVRVGGRVVAIAEGELSVP